jgi:hypothetical protein
MTTPWRASNHFRLCQLTLVAIALAGVVACSGKDSPAAPAPTTPSLAVPTAKSPTGGSQTQTLRPALEVNNAVATGAVGAVTYRFELSELPDFPVGSRSTAMDNVPQGAGSTSVLVPNDLVPAKVYYWHARATSGAITTAYSTTESFRAENRGFKSGQTIWDPLTNGLTVADEVHGGHFVSGENGGWQTDSLYDSLDYNIPTCTNCRVEFDVTNVDRSTAPEDVDQKLLSMGDGSTFDNIFAFRDHVWTMHIEKRSGDGGAIKLIWRRGCNDSDSCDNTDNFKVPISWEPAKVYHFTLEWGAGAMGVNVCEYVGGACGATIYTATGSGTYAPSNHRIELGTRPRGETLVGARFRNLRVTPR